MLLLLTLAACREDLYRGLSQRDANEMSALLLERGIDVERRLDADGRVTLLVEEAQFPEAIEALGRAGYPKESFSSLAEIFPGNGIIVSPFEQRARLMYALGQELSRTVSTIEGVVSARVHVAVPEDNIRLGSREAPSASVLVRIRPDADAVALSQRIRSLVASGVPGLDVKAVSITFDAGPSQAPAPAWATAASPVPAETSGGLASILWIGAALLFAAGLVQLARSRKAARKDGTGETR